MKFWFGSDTNQQLFLGDLDALGVDYVSDAKEGTVAISSQDLTPIITDLAHMLGAMER